MPNAREKKKRESIQAAKVAQKKQQQRKPEQPPAEPQIDSIEVVERVLARTEVSALHEDLSTARTKLTAEEQDHLLAILTKLSTSVVVNDVRALLLKPAAELHCVRCHKTYMEKDNGLTSCKIRHKILEEPERGLRAEYIWSCSSCDAEEVCASFCGGPEFASKPCYIGVHTTDRWDVIYGVNTKTCEKRGCHNGGIGKDGVNANEVVTDSDEDKDRFY